METSFDHFSFELEEFKVRNGTIPAQLSDLQNLCLSLLQLLPQTLPTELQVQSFGELLKVLSVLN
jgi:hypothetical protein